MHPAANSDARTVTVEVVWSHTAAGPERTNRVLLIEGYTLENRDESIPKILAIKHLSSSQASEIVVRSVTEVA